MSLRVRLYPRQRLQGLNIKAGGIDKMVDSEMIYYIGIITIGVAVLIAAVAASAFFIIGKRLKKQLDDDYGNNSRTV